MIGRHDAGPDRSGDAHVAEAHGHGPAAAAVAVRLDAVDLTDTGGQAGDAGALVTVVISTVTP